MYIEGALLSKSRNIALNKLPKALDYVSCITMEKWHAVLPTLWSLPQWKPQLALGKPIQKNTLGVLT